MWHGLQPFPRGCILQTASDVPFSVIFLPLWSFSTIRYHESASIEADECDTAPISSNDIFPLSPETRIAFVLSFFDIILTWDFLGKPQLSWFPIHENYSFPRYLSKQSPMQIIQSVPPISHGECVVFLIFPRKKGKKKTRSRKRERVISLCYITDFGFHDSINHFIHLCILQYDVSDFGFVCFLGGEYDFCG